MGEVLKYMLLGLLQGATEFLPVSSSGHLVILKNLLGVESNGLLLEVCLHLGTLVAILLVFRSDLWKLIVDGVKGAWLLARGRRAELAEAAPGFSTALAIVVGSVPVAAAGLLIHRLELEEGLKSPRLAGAMLVVTGLVLAAGRLAPRGGLREGPGAARGFLIGIAQAVAILPGISRSGSTIVAGCFLGLRREAAARFSFLLAVPAMVGAGVWKLAPALASGGDAWAPTGGGLSFAIVCGTIVAALSGWACLSLLLRIIRRGQLHWFAAYCVPAGLACFILSFIL
ncbi:MAG: undecaprenyl-diphosphate phosphatase [Candidatus Brocadiia bacterium]|jgi:undecaprenyl-diphosphatase|nr:undecaprenyl-diphosphate phosphatase [Candidatus Brocadiia bacterium]